MTRQQESAANPSLAAWARRSMAFIVSGVLNLLVTAAVYWLLLPFAHYVGAYLIAFAAGVVFATVANSRFVFSVPVRMGNIFPVAAWYAINAALGSSILVFLVSEAGWSREVAFLVLAAALAPLSYVAMKLIFLRRWL